MKNLEKRGHCGPGPRLKSRLRSRFSYKHLLCAILLAVLGNLSILPAQTVTESWATLPPNSYPQSIAINGGILYVANNNSTISKITLEGVVTAEWAVLPPFTYPVDLVIDTEGNLYTANYGTHSVSKITPDGTVTETWAMLANEATPNSITIDGSGNLYVANGGNSTVSRITPDGTVTQDWVRLAANALPWSIIMDGSGNFYTDNAGNNTISKISPDGTLTEAWATINGQGASSAIAFDNSGNLYSTHLLNGVISKITPDVVITENWAALNNAAVPYSIIKDREGNLYTANSGNSTISKITPDGLVTQAWATLATGATPGSIVLDASGNMYTANNGNSTVSKIQPPIHPDLNGILYVDSAAAAGGDGSSWGTALSQLSDALKSAEQINRVQPDLVKQIWIAKGTYYPLYYPQYTPTAGMTERDKTFMLVKNVELFGGFQGTEATQQDRSLLTGKGTILSGDIGVLGNSSDNAYHVVCAVNDGNAAVAYTLNNVTITAGNANLGNTTSIKGRSIFRNQGAGIEAYYANIRLSNCLLIKNNAREGAAFMNAHGDASGYVNNCTFFSNKDDGGNAIYNFQTAGPLMIENSIVMDGIHYEGLAPVVYSSLVQGMAASAENHTLAGDTDPQFMDAAGGDYHLSANSPAINTGDNALLYGYFDLDNNTRIYDQANGGIIDLGAFEFQGNGTLPVTTSPLSGTVSKDNQVILTWQTYTETANKGFQVQYSLDGTHFENGPFEPSMAIDGNSTTALHYTVNAGELVSGVKYYRLQQIDLNGNPSYSYSYSNIIRLTGLNTGFQLKVYPNPAHNYTYIHLDGVSERALNGKGEVIIVDMAGRTVKRQEITATETDTKIDLSGLAPGVYILKYADGVHYSNVKILKK